MKKENEKNVDFKDSVGLAFNGGFFCDDDLWYVFAIDVCKKEVKIEMEILALIGAVVLIGMFWKPFLIGVAVILGGITFCVLAALIYWGLFENRNENRDEF